MDNKQLIRRIIIVGLALIVISLVFIFGEKSFFGKEGIHPEETQEGDGRLFQGPTGTPYVKGPTTPPPGGENIK